MSDYGYKVLGRISDNAKTRQAGVITFETIRRFPGGHLRCTCGGHIQIDRNDLDYRESSYYRQRACSHLTALFFGRVTEDLAESKRSYLAGDPGQVRPLVELRDEGKKFFGWRWAARSMEEKKPR